MTVNPYVPDAVKTVLLTENATVLTLRVSGILSIRSKPTTVFFILKILMAISVFSTCSPNSSTNCIPLTALLGFFFFCPQSRFVYCLCNSPLNSLHFFPVQAVTAILLTHSSPRVLSSIWEAVDNLLTTESINKKK